MALVFMAGEARVFFFSRYAAFAAAYDLVMLRQLKDVFASCEISAGISMAMSAMSVVSRLLRDMIAFRHVDSAASSFPFAAYL